MNVVVNLESIVGLAIAIIVPLGLGLLWLLDRIACAVRKRQQQRIDEAYADEELIGTDMGGGIRRDDAGNVIDWGITGPPGDVGKAEEE